MQQNFKIYPTPIPTLTYSIWTLNPHDFVGKLEESLCGWDHEVGDSVCWWNYREGGNSSSGDPKLQHSCSFEELGEIPSLEEPESNISKITTHKWQSHILLNSNFLLNTWGLPQKGSSPLEEWAFLQGIKINDDDDDETDLLFHLSSAPYIITIIIIHNIS